MAPGTAGRRGRCTDNQLAELRAYTAARGWTASDYIDEGISGAKASRPALDRLMADARRHRFRAVCVWSLDRFGRSLAHIVATVNEMQERGIAFISLREGIDLSTAAGRLQLHIVAALAEFERERTRERIYAGLARAKRPGHRPGPRARQLTPADLRRVASLTVREAAAALSVSTATVHRARRALVTNPPSPETDFRREPIDVESGSACAGN